MTTEEQLVDLTKRLDDHLENFNIHEAHEIERHRQLLMSQQLNTEALNELATSTAGLVEAWSAAEGAVKVGAAVGKVIKWAAGFAVLAGALSWIGIPHK